MTRCAIFLTLGAALTNDSFIYYENNCSFIPNNNTLISNIKWYFLSKTGNKADVPKVVFLPVGGFRWRASGFVYMLGQRDFRVVFSVRKNGWVHGL
jgi:hypothetical protein